MALKTDYKNYVPSTELRQYQLINNSNGTVSLQDVTVYEQVGDLFSAGDINATNAAVNAIQEDIPSIQSGANTWIASQVTAVNAEAFQYDLTIANYIPAVGNVIVFQAPSDAGESFLFTINGAGPSSGTWYQVALSDLSVDVTGAWAGTAMLNVIVSGVVGETGNTLAFVAAGGGGGVSGIAPSYTGNSQIFGDGSKGYIECYSSGILTFNKDVTVDIFLVGGGGGGFSSSQSPGGPGGGGGYTRTARNLQATAGTEYPVTIGAGGSAGSPGTSGGTTTAFELSANGGGTGSMPMSQANTTIGGSGGCGGGAGSVYSIGPGGAGGENGGDGGQSTNGSYVSLGGTGQGTSTYEFMDSQLRLFAGGGGGGGGYMGSTGSSSYSQGGAGGAGGGGNGGDYRYENSSATTNGTSGQANTGGGGGGSGGGRFGKLGGAGGSGIAIIRWGDWTATA